MAMAAQQTARRRLQITAWESAALHAMVLLYQGHVRAPVRCAAIDAAQLVAMARWKPASSATMGAEAMAMDVRQIARWNPVGIATDRHRTASRWEAFNSNVSVCFSGSRNL
jgi:hypothetical protein